MCVGKQFVTPLTYNFAVSFPVVVHIGYVCAIVRRGTWCIRPLCYGLGVCSSPHRSWMWHPPCNLCECIGMSCLTGGIQSLWLGSILRRNRQQTIAGCPLCRWWWHWHTLSFHWQWFPLVRTWQVPCSRMLSAHVRGIRIIWLKLKLQFFSMSFQYYMYAFILSCTQLRTIIIIVL